MLLRLVIMIIALMFVPDAYIYYMYVKRWSKSVWLRMLYFIPSLLLLTAFLIIICNNCMRPDNQPATNTFVAIFLTISIPKAIFMLFDGIGHGINWIITKGAKRREDYDCIFVRFFRIIGMTLAMTGLFVLCYGYFVGRHHFIIHKQTLYFTDLPKAFDGYRIVHFSDLHAGSFHDGNEQDVRRIVDLINQQKADIILFTGDIVSTHSAELDGFRLDLNKLYAPDGVYSVLGNHDYGNYFPFDSEADKEADVLELQRRQRDYGWTLLLNDHKFVHRGNDSIAIIGSENDGRPPFPTHGDIKKATKGIRKGVFSILLTHDPTHWRRVVIPETDIQLTLSGHTHAGQFKVFGWSPIQFMYKEWSGLYKEGKQTLNINDGVGAALLPFRFGAWPEINVITLKKQ